MSWTIIVVLLIGFLGWAYQAFCPPPPRLSGSSGGPPLEGPRIRLRDGRHLSYKEHGVSKETAKYKIILVHGFSSSKHEASITESEMVDKLGIYFVSFDRPGYGESDPNPKRTIKSTALDIEELGDQLKLGPKFYIIGISMGGQVVWGCLKYIPHRLAGAALIAPVVNYWWPGFPSDLATEAYYLQPAQDQWALRVAHHAPWLVYWWNTQKWFPGSSVASGRPNLTAPDLQIISKVAAASRQSQKEYATQQGVHESYYRDMMVGFGSWEFDPMDLDNPFVHGEGSVHLWHGIEDGMVPVSLQRYIVKKLPWIQYHELSNAGHLFYAETAAKDAIFSTFLTANDN
ncbi:alpha/beta-Hydrolases superfamily protein [Perilla frutescens var. frutescens]|nr:alpha/beta-Hydrolases superfamily protein [Perilla frutescens var. frutescens]